LSSTLEVLLSFQIKAAALPEPEREYRFDPDRRWRFDFAWPAYKLAVECEGGTWVNGAHNRGEHFESDCEKYNAAALAGWHVLRLTVGMIKSGEALQAIEEDVQSLVHSTSQDASTEMAPSANNQIHVVF
jgi:very-short-patch-repair endonuclease